jgi:hypothetical protein
MPNFNNEISDRDIEVLVALVETSQRLSTVLDRSIPEIFREALLLAREKQRHHRAQIMAMTNMENKH